MTDNWGYLILFLALVVFLVGLTNVRMRRRSRVRKYQR